MSELKVKNEKFPPVLMYHSVGPYHIPASWVVSRESFAAQMRWLYRRGLRGVSMRELLFAREEGAEGSLVGLTFDDGYEDFAAYALPLLQSYGFTATAFVIADRLGGENSWAYGDRKQLMSAQAVKRVAAAGMEIGSHGRSHAPLPSLPDMQLIEEIEGSRRILQTITNQEVLGFCYPYGKHDRRIVNAVKAAGYHYSCAIAQSDYTGIYALPRIDIADGDSPLHLWMKSSLHWLRWRYRGPGARLLAHVSQNRSKRET